MKTVDVVLDNGLEFYGSPCNFNQVWKGSLDCVAFESSRIKEKLLTLDQPCYIVKVDGKIGVTNDGYLSPLDNGNSGQIELLMVIPPIKLQQLGDPNFLAFHAIALLR